MKELLEIRKKIKNRKPVFVRQDAHKKVEIGWKWRRPKGLDSKMRLRKRGYRRCVEVGWGSPKKIKNFDKSGLKIRLISSIKELDNINAKTEGIIVGKCVGLKKRILLLKKTEEMKITVLNIKNVAKYLKEAEEYIRKKKEKRKEFKKEKDKTKGKEIKKEKGKGIEKIMSDEEKKKEEKKEKDSLLTKKILK